VTVRPHPRPCLQISVPGARWNFSRAAIDATSITLSLSCWTPTVASLVHCELIGTKSLARDASWYENRFPSLSASSRRICFQSPGFSCRNSDVRKPGALSGYGVNGPRFGERCRPRLPCTRGTKSTRSQHSLAKIYRRSLFGEPLAAAGGAEFGAVPSANTVSWPPRDV
jgi:hypothetical protein